MGDKEQQQGSIRRLVGRIAPGLEAFSRYEMSWLATDIGAGLSVAAVARPGIMLAINARPADAVLGRVPGMKGFHDRDHSVGNCVVLLT